MKKRGLKAGSKKRRPKNKSKNPLILSSMGCGYGKLVMPYYSCFSPLGSNFYSLTVVLKQFH